MPATLRQRLAESGAALAGVFRSPNLRRIQLAWAGSIVGQYAYVVALAIYAYRHGGAAVVGVVAIARLIPASIVAPFAAVLADRVRRERVMLASDLGRAAVVAAAAAVVFFDGPPALVFALASVGSMVSTLFKPAEAALLPSLARTPQELAAANVASSTLESVGSFAGPAIGGILVATASVGTTFAFTAGMFLWSAFLVARLRPDSAVEEATAPVEREERDASLRHEVLAGFRTILVEPKLRLIVGLYSAQTIVAGALGVLVVVIALDLLDIGDAGVGWLNAASGIGGLVGAAVALALVARRRLGADFGLGIVLWGLPLLAIGIWPNQAVALVALAVLGLGNTLVDVSGLTLLQRGVPDEVLARVFGVMESLFVATMGLGAILAPALVGAFGARTALVVTGAFLPLLAALVWSRLAALDRDAHVPERELELLAADPIFAPLAARTLEQLAHALVPVAVEAGRDVVRAGDHGDRFYLVDSGEAEVLVDGETSRLGPGDSFGEIALLRDVPRTATVRALGDLRLYALDRDEFLAAVTGHAPSRDAAEAVAAERLAPRPGVAW